MIKPLNSKYINLYKKNNSVTEPLQARVSKMLQDFSEKISAKDLDFYYEPINANVQNLEKEVGTKAAAITLKFQEQNKHMLEISVLDRSMEKENTRPILIGTKKEILDFIQKENCVSDFIKTIKEMSVRLI